MLNSAWCLSSEHNWLVVKGTYSHLLFSSSFWYAKLLILSFILLVAITCPSLLRRKSHKRGRNHRGRQSDRLIQLEIGILLVLLLGLSPAGAAIAQQGLVGFLPNDAGEPVDAIVVLGRGHRFSPQRVETVAELWQARRAPLIFASGAGDAPEMVAMLRQKGVPESALDGEGCSLTTEENASFTASLLKPKGIQKILLVTDYPHMLRSLLTFQRFGFKVIPQPTDLPPFISDRRKSMLMFAEYSAILSYGLQGRFFPETPRAQ